MTKSRRHLDLDPDKSLWTKEESFKTQDGSKGTGKHNATYHTIRLPNAFRTKMCY